MKLMYYIKSVGIERWFVATDLREKLKKKCVEFTTSKKEMHFSLCLPFREDWRMCLMRPSWQLLSPQTSNPRSAAFSYRRYGEDEGVDGQGRDQSCMGAEGGSAMGRDVDACLNSAFSRSDLTWVWYWNRVALYFTSRYKSLYYG